LPLIAWALDDRQATPGMLLCMAAASIFIVAKHHDNIRRLLARTENRFSGRRG
jgi:glycerol-3-phosphate acyltransferase PlsY